MMIDSVSGQTLPAAQMLSAHDVFPPGSAYAQAVVAAPAPNVAVPPVARAAEASLVSRWLALFIDVLCSFPVAIFAAIPLVGLIGTPLLVLYWLSRDSFFGCQSLGKRALNTKKRIGDHLGGTLVVSAI